MRTTSTTPIGLTMLLALALTLTACSGDEKDTSEKPLGSAPDFTVGANAADYCSALLTDTVQEMTAALPDIGAGLEVSAEAKQTVLAGAADLREAASDLPSELAEVASSAATAIEEYVKAPEKKASIDAVLQALQGLSENSAKECDL